MRTNYTRLERIVVWTCLCVISVAVFTLPRGCTPEPEGSPPPAASPAPATHVPGPTPSGRRKGDVPPKVSKKPLGGV